MEESKSAENRERQSNVSTDKEKITFGEKWLKHLEIVENKKIFSDVLGFLQKSNTIMLRFLHYKHLCSPLCFRFKQPNNFIFMTPTRANLLEQ